MEIAVLSDLHLGYDRGRDPLTQAKEALDLAAKADLILIPGDIFDQRVPRQETMAKALELFSGVKPPLITISGTHERRSSGYINPVQALEKAGFLAHLHCTSKTHSVDGEKINIFGLSGVPERYAGDILRKWNPRPKQGLNILMLHQNLKKYIYTPFEPTTLSLSEFPKGFDLYVCGHIHWRDEAKTPWGAPVLLPGSTIRTQLRKSDLEPKGVTFFSPPANFRFEKLTTQPKFFYETIRFNKASPAEVLDQIGRKLKTLDTRDALIKIKLTGTLSPAFNRSDVNLRKIKSDARALSIDKAFESREKSARKIQHTSESIDELGLRLLREKLGKDPEPLFQYLRDGDLERAKEKLLS